MTVLSAIVLLGVLIFVHELGHFIVAKLSGVKVLRFSLGFGPKVVGKRWGETEYLLSALPLGGYVKMLGEEPEEELPLEEAERAFNRQPLHKRAMIVFAGPLFNILLTYLIFSLVLTAGLPINIPVIKQLKPTIDSVEEGYPAHKAGLKPGDLIKEIDGRPIDTWFDLVSIVSKSPDKELEFTVLRGEQLLKVKIKPQRVEEEGPQGEKVVIGRIGVRKTGGSFFESIEAKGLLQAPIKGAWATYRMGLFIVDSIRMLLTGEVSFKNLGGPVTILKESGKAASAGILAYVMFMALLSVNLGVLNLLPIPILDGGHLLLFLVEALKGEPLNERTVLIVHRIGYAILIILMGFALYNDIVRIFTDS
ncbi:MAG: RIP metalloprotease RseP [Nitrospirae bacterium]|nr:MAG: RIP metalloprotease RseP [Nitrospirota bacterium]